MSGLEAFAAPIDTPPSLPLVSTSMSGVAEVEVATVQAYGVLLGIVVVEFTESLMRPPLKTGVPAKVGEVAKTKEPLPVWSETRPARSAEVASEDDESFPLSAVCKSV
jgi:hypothetical protein